jgi:hypothetical protein
MIQHIIQDGSEGPIQVKLRYILLATSLLPASQPVLAQEQQGADDTIVVISLRQAYTGDFDEREVPARSP